MTWDNWTIISIPQIRKVLLLNKFHIGQCSTKLKLTVLFVLVHSIFSAFTKLKCVNLLSHITFLTTKFSQFMLCLGVIQSPIPSLLHSITQGVIIETLFYLIVYLPVECHLMGVVQFCRHLLAPQGRRQQCAGVCPKSSALFSNVSVCFNKKCI